MLSLQKYKSFIHRSYPKLAYGSIYKTGLRLVLLKFKLSSCSCLLLSSFLNKIYIFQILYKLILVPLVITTSQYGPISFWNVFFHQWSKLANLGQFGVSHGIDSINSNPAVVAWFVEHLLHKKWHLQMVDLVQVSAFNEIK